MFPDWSADQVEDEREVHALKYFGYCQASERIKGEYQIVSMLTGLFWEVEHAAIYKPDPRLTGIAMHRGMRDRTRAVTKALRAFEDQFEVLAREG